MALHWKQSAELSSRPDRAKSSDDDVLRTPLCRSLSEHDAVLARAVPAFARTIQTASWARGLSVSDAINLYALALAWQPDVIVEVSQRDARLTACVLEIASRVGCAEIRRVALDDIEARSLISSFADASPFHEAADRFDRRVVEFSPDVGTAHVRFPCPRVLVVWDLVGLRGSDDVLGTLLPAFASGTVLVALLGVFDTRYIPLSGEYGASGVDDYWQGHLASPSADLLAVFEFASRNKLSVHTGCETGEALDASDSERALGDALRRVGQGKKPLLNSHLAYFALPSNETRALHFRRTHHPVIRTCPQWQGWIDAGTTANFLGVVTSARYFEASERVNSQRFVNPSKPAFDEEYFEWVDVLEAVASAESQFTMVDVGAGWGRWLVNGGVAAKRLRGLPYLLVGIEPEPTHFAWMNEHVHTNGLDIDRVRLLNAAVTAAAGPGPVELRVADSPHTYAQVVREAPSQGVAHEDSMTGTPVLTTRVACITLDTVLEQLARDTNCVDLIDIDVEGAEASILSASAEAIDRVVKRVHIGTHSSAIESDLRCLFEGMGWRALAQYPCRSEQLTPWGRFAFDDGVQTWINPKLVATASIRRTDRVRATDRRPGKWAS
jgi:FkbM family methyltransferase